MPAFILYLLKSSLSLSAVWLFYRLILRSLTFYTLNRWALLGYSLLSFIIPLIRISPLQTPAIYSFPIGLIPSLADYKLIVAAPPSPGINWWLLLELTLCLGAGILLIRTAVRWLSLRRIQKNAVLISDTGIKIYHVDRQIIPFSFGRAIYINPQLHSESEWEEIILHEYIHIRQRHTFDILLAELRTILSWYNPFAWLIRHSIRQNLEFIADAKVLDTGFDKKEYQYHLLKVVGQSQYRLANNFNFSSLKKRIVMMNKMKSARLNLLRFLFILPLLAVLLLAFRSRHITSPRGTSHNKPVVYLPGKTALSIPIVRPAAHALPIRQQPMVASADTIPPFSGMVGGLDSDKALWVVDGVIRTNGLRDSLNPRDISSISILKGDEAYKLFGERGVHGVIAVITKANAHFQINPGPSADSQHVQKNEPLYMVDGKRIFAPDFNDIDPNDIASIQVIKNAAAMAIYGPEARNGVILITLLPHNHIRSVLDSGSRRHPITIAADTLHKNDIQIRLRG